MNKQTVSHFQIIEILGTGGMGEVYRALDTKLNRRVVLKFASQEQMEEPEARRRLVREARAAAALNHKNVCTIYEVGEVQAGDDLRLETDESLSPGTPFIAMELIDGKPLDRMLSPAGALPLDDMLDIALQTAEGLAEAHRHGIVHRDLKPQNVMVTPAKVVKILDFGLAKPSASGGETVPEALLATAPITQEGTLLGTAPYMSPEQVMAKEADSRSDVFSFGVMLYEMVAGNRPFGGANAHEIMANILSAEPPPLSESRADLPAELDRIVSRCLRKKPEDRYNDTRDLVAELRDLVHGPESQPHDAAAPTEQTAGEFRGRWWLGGGALAAAVIAGFIWLGPFGSRESGPSIEPQDLSLAVVDFQDLENTGELTQSVGLTGLVHVGLVEASPCRVVSPTYLYDLRRRLFGSGRGPIEPDQALNVAREAGATMLLTGQMMGSGDVSYVTWQLTDTENGSSLEAHRVQGTDLTRIADEVIAGVLPLLARQCRTEPPTQRPVGTLTTENPEAYRHYAAGVLAAERSETQDAVLEFEQALEQDSTFALAAFALGRLYQYRMTDARRGVEYGELAWRHRSSLGVKDRIRVEAWLAQVRGEIGKALPIYRELCERWPDDRDALGDFASVLFYHWDFHEAAEVAGQAYRLFPDDFNLGEMALAAHSYAGAQDLALAVARANRDRHPDHPEAWCDLGWAYLYVGEPDSAETMFRKSLDIDLDYLSGRRRGLSEVFYARGEMKKAIENWEEILNRPDLSAGQRVSFLSRDDLGPTLPMLHAEAGRFQQALEMLKDAANSARTQLHYANASRRTWLWRLGRVAEYERLVRELSGVLGNNSVDRLRMMKAQGLLWVARDSLDAAREAAKTLRDLRTQVGRVAEAWAFELEAQIALADKDPAAALAALSGQRNIVAHPGGMVDIQYRENLSHAYRLAGRREDAAETLEDLVQRYRGHAVSHYELGKIYEEMHREGRAAGEYEVFLQAWSEADEGLPQVADAKKRLATLKPKAE